MTIIDKLQRSKSQVYYLIFFFITRLLISCGEQSEGSVIIKMDPEAYVGQSLNLSADINTGSDIDDVEVIINPVSGQGWIYTHIYDDISGLSKATFETDLVIPDTALQGDYILTLRVNDQSDSPVEVSTRFHLSMDASIPLVSDLDVGINAKGDDLHLETELTAPAKIKVVSVLVKGNNWDKTFHFEGKRLVDQLSYHFHEHVHIGEAPPGIYQVILRLVDQKDRFTVAEGTFTKK